MEQKTYKTISAWRRLWVSASRSGGETTATVSIDFDKGKGPCSLVGHYLH